jgi:hypothetical protein
MDGRINSGRATANKMTPEQRKERALKGVEARKYKDSLPSAKFDGKLNIVDLQLDVAVLDNEKRVITQQAVWNALANTFIYRDVPKLEIGDIIYSDSTCTSRLNGGNLWYSISSLYDIAPVIKINSSGVILEVEYCNSGPSGGGCLLEGTEVILSNGEIKEIQDLTLGDKLLSYNIETLPLYSDDPNVITNWNSDNILGTSDITIVKSIKPTVVDKIVNINNILKSSIEHIHLIKRDGIWKFVEAIDVKTNDIMMNNLNEEFIVNNIEIINGVFTVYDIDVEDLDLFYGNGVLTHNNKVPIEP